MDQVPFDFRQQVAALWKCCERDYNDKHRWEECVDQKVPDCAWTMKSRKERIDFHIGHDRGKWKFCFSYPDRIEGVKEALSTEELMKHRNLKHVAIRKIEVMDRESSGSFLWSHNSIKLQNLRKVVQIVAFLSNEPSLHLDRSIVHRFNSPEGRALLESLSKMSFSEIKTSVFSEVIERLFENQFSRRKPTQFILGSPNGNEEFFVEHLGNGSIRRFITISKFHFPPKVMQEIIQRVLENPQIYHNDKFCIFASFDAATKMFLIRSLKEGRCTWYDNSYCFKACDAAERGKDRCIFIKYTGSLSVRMLVK